MKVIKTIIAGIGTGIVSYILGAVVLIIINPQNSNAVFETQLLILLLPVIIGACTYIIYTAIQDLKTEIANQNNQKEEEEKTEM